MTSVQGYNTHASGKQLRFPLVCNIHVKCKCGWYTCPIWALCLPRGQQWETKGERLYKIADLMSSQLFALGLHTPLEESDQFIRLLFRGYLHLHCLCSFVGWLRWIEEDCIRYEIDISFQLGLHAALEKLVPFFMSAFKGSYFHVPLFRKIDFLMIALVKFRLNTVTFHGNADMHDIVHNTVMNKWEHRSDFKPQKISVHHRWSAAFS